MLKLHAELTCQFDSFVPVWAYDEPKKKKRLVKKDKSGKKLRGGKSAESSERSGKETEETPAAPVEGLQRRTATVEDVEE
jgi:hypothetical protein